MPWIRPTFSEGVMLIRWPYGRKYPGHEAFLSTKVNEVYKDKATGELKNHTVTQTGIPRTELYQHFVDDVVKTVLTIIACLAVIAGLVIAGYYLHKFLNEPKGE